MDCVCMCTFTNACESVCANVGNLIPQPSGVVRLEAKLKECVAGADDFDLCAFLS